jgi:hypothetical protein
MNSTYLVRYIEEENGVYDDAIRLEEWMTDGKMQYDVTVYGGGVPIAISRFGDIRHARMIFGIVKRIYRLTGELDDIVKVVECAQPGQWEEEDGDDIHLQLLQEDEENL